MSAEYEHRVQCFTNDPDHFLSTAAWDEVDERHRALLINYVRQNGGGHIDIQRRPVSPWEDVERIDVPKEATP